MPKKKTATKAPEATDETTTAAPATDPSTIEGTIAWLAKKYTDHLVRIGHSEGTARSYMADLAVAKKHFGPDRDIKTLTVAEVAEFFESDRVTKKRNGKKKNEISIAKTRRVFRLALGYAEEKGWVTQAPIPPKPMAAVDAVVPETPADAPAPDAGAAVATETAPAETARPRRGGKKAKTTVAAE